MIKAGIIGSTGYAGQELARLLMQHPDAEIVWLGSKSYVGCPYSDIYGNMYKIADENCLDDDIDKLADAADVIFTATPQGYSSSVISEDILGRAKLIDLSADFRFKDVSVYSKWYGMEHQNPSFAKEAVYGLCEINREDIRKARLVANPGCYTTCSILALYPLVKEDLIDPDTIIIDAKSGTSGAGRSAKTDNLYCEVNENIKAYSVTTHRHTPEIEEQLGYAAGRPVVLTFTPHLVPMERGILVTAYASLEKGIKDEDIRNAYEKYYGKEHFIRLLKDGACPETRWVRGSNYVDIGFKIDPRCGRVIVMGAIDNLVKGAAGQAVQNMNIMFGLKENEGLDMIPLFP